MNIMKSYATDLSWCAVIFYLFFVVVAALRCSSNFSIPKWINSIHCTYIQRNMLCYNLEKMQSFNLLRCDDCAVKTPIEIVLQSLKREKKCQIHMYIFWLHDIHKKNPDIQSERSKAQKEKKTSNTKRKEKMLHFIKKVYTISWYHPKYTTHTQDGSEYGGV